MSWKVLITARTLDVVGDSAVALMKQAGLELIHPEKPGPLSAEELQPLLEGMDAVLASMDKFTPAVLASNEARSLKIISRWGVGYDAIDIPAATREGVVVAYTPGLLNNAVADFTFALLLGVARRIPEGHEKMRQGQWGGLWGHDIGGKTIGLIGCGRIGMAVVRRALGFGMKVLAYDVAPSAEAESLGVQFVSLDQLLRESDYVSLHAALTTENRGLIGEAQLKSMKSNAFLINTARGALVDETALVKALTENWIAGAALDAYVEEPLPEGHPLQTAPNLVLAPHHSSFGRDTGERVSLAAAQAIVDLSQGKRPGMVVDTAVFESPALRASLKSS